MSAIRRLVLAMVLLAGTLSLRAGIITLDCPAWAWAGPFTVVSNIVGGNSLTNLFRQAPFITAVYVWNPSIQDFEMYGNESFGGTPWSPRNAILNSQDAVFVVCPIDHTFTWITIDGAVPPPQPLNLASNSYYLRGPLFHGNSKYEDIVGTPPTSGTSLLRYIGGPSGPIYPPKPPTWQAYHFIDGAWTPSEPVLDPLEAAFVVYPTLQIKVAITGAPPVMVLTWPRGKLEASDQPNGPWQTVTNAQAPFVVDLGSPMEPSRFYRVREWP